MGPYGVMGYKALRPLFRLQVGWFYGCISSIGTESTVARNQAPNMKKVDVTYVKYHAEVHHHVELVSPESC